MFPEPVCDQTVLNPVLTVPVRANEERLAQTVSLDVICTFGLSNIVTLKVLVSALQLPLLVEVRVMVSEPSAVSVLLIRYEVFNCVFEGLKAPAPVVVQIPVVVGPVTSPLRFICEVFEQITRSGPDVTTGGSVK